MKKERLIDILRQTKNYLSKEWLITHKAFFEEEILQLFAEKLIYYHQSGVSNKLLLPLFKDELTPLLKESFAFFKVVLQTFEKNNFEEKAVSQELARIIEYIDFKHVLLLLGQRITSATLQNADGIPPLQSDLMIASFQPYNSQVSKVVRAFEKHAERSEDNYWGIVTGNPKEKVEKVRDILTSMFDEKTWWNVFYHFKHELIYEIRIPSGHGARWKKSNLEFIGFVEPFLD